YEMASGRRAFERASPVETAAAVITDPVAPIDSHRGDLPTPLQWAIERCLSKDVADRYPSVRALQRDLVAVRERLSDVRGVATDTRLVLPAIAQAVGVDGTLDPADAIAQRLRTQRAPVVFVIDNFEQVADAAAVLAQLLEKCANLTLMVTSRALLYVYGERE